MKKNLFYFFTAFLAFIPLLISSSHYVYAEEATLSTEEIASKDNTTNEIIVDDPSVSNKPVVSGDADEDSSQGEVNEQLSTPLPVKSKEIDTFIDTKGDITLAKYKDVVLDGEFVPKKYETIEIDKLGNWYAHTSGNESIVIEYQPTVEKLAELKEKYPNDNFTESFKSEPLSINVSTIMPFENSRSIETTESSTSESTENSKTKKEITLTFKNQEITTTVSGIGRLIPNDYDGVKITGEFVPSTESDSISIDKLGNWKALKEYSGSFTPKFNLSDESLKALQDKYPNEELTITNEAIQVKISAVKSGDNSVSNTSKKGEPVTNKLPQTGEEKMRFAGIIGIVILLIVVVLYFLKKKNQKNKND